MSVILRSYTCLCVTEPNSAEFVVACFGKGRGTRTIHFEYIYETKSYARANTIPGSKWRRPVETVQRYLSFGARFAAKTTLMD